MQSSNTKDRILFSALDLFARNGYDGVGVDQIAANAGVKGPSIYKHFAGKESIFTALIDRADAYYEKNFGSVQHPGRVPASAEEFVVLSMGRIRFTMQDPLICKMRRLLTMEQFRSARVANLTTMHNVVGIRNMYSRIFACMMEEGTIRRDDPDLLATMIVSPVTLYIQMADRAPECRDEALHEIEEYLRTMAERICKDGITYRKACPDDAEAIAALLGRAAGAMKAEGIDQWDELYPDITDVTSDIEADSAFVGLLHGTIVSCCTINQMYDDEYRTASWNGEEAQARCIHRLCVDPNVQGRGIGRATLCHAENLIRAFGGTSVRLDVFTQNPHALALYQRSGYVPRGEANWRKGRFLLMEKNLTDGE